jgi:iron(III) transport system permease protein
MSAVPDRVPLPAAPSKPARRLPVSGFQVVILAIGVLVAGTVLITLGRLAVWAWDEYGTDIPSFYWHDVFGNAALRKTLLNTAIVMIVSSALATFIAAILAWLNERTDATIGMVGRVLPLIPFLMPAIALPLGWLFLASPRAGALNLLIRAALDRIGIHLTDGPLDVYSWPGLVFLYTVFLCGFAYLVIASSMRTLDRGLEEAAKIAGARPLRILFRIILPALRPAMFGAFLMCLIVAVVMVSVPITIGPGANIPVLSVLLVDLVTTQSPPQYGQAFLIGLLLLVPIMLAWWMQRRTAARGRFAVIGGKVAVGQMLQLGPWRKAVGRAIFLGYALVAVVLPLIGLIYVSGMDYWSSVWPEKWSPVANVRAAIDDPVIRRAILTSVTLGVVTGAALVLIAHLVAYGQRLFPRLGHFVDGLTKTPAVVAQILIAIALLVTLGASPFNLSAGWLLFIGYLVVFLPFASVLTTGAQHQIGKDVVEAAKSAGASDLRTFRSIVTPLTRPALVATFMLMYVLVSGETNISLILASTQRPVVGFVMLDLFNFASFPKVASFALVITAVNLTVVAVFMKVLSGRTRFGVR